MTEAQDPKLLWFSFIKIFTRALVQINLYKPDHPQVKLALEEGQMLLGQISDTLSGGDFSLTIDGGKLMVNGAPIAPVDKLPNALKNLYSAFHLQTITFSKGVTGQDLLALCQIQAHKGDVKAFMKERGIEKITLNESVYAKVDPAMTQFPAETVSEAGGQAGPGKMADKISDMGLDAAISTIVSRATSDAEEQKRILEILAAKFRKEIETSVTRALKEVRREKKKIENDMVRAESVLASLAEGMVIVDKDGRILMMNPQAESMSGKPLSELSGKKIMDLFQIEDQVVSLAKEIKSDGNADISREISATGPSELAKTVKQATTIIQNEEGKIVGTMSVPTDTAKLKQVEQLQRDFVANITHELRSPLTAIKAALEILNRKSDDADPSRGILNNAIRNTERLNSIITDLLDFSTLQSGKMIFHQKDTPAEEITKEAAESMKAWGNSKGVTLTMSTDPGVPHVYADKRRTVQVLINLISNAIKFTPQGGSIEIHAAAGAEPGFTLFSVKDNGCGIKKEDQVKIFEKFWQVSIGEKIGGTGLGLAITKAMVVMQGGRVALESEPGRGSTFRVWMPVYRGQGEQPVAGQLPEVKPGKKPWWKRFLGK